MNEKTPVSSFDEDNLVQDVGIFKAHPEIVEENPATSSEWTARLERHKALAATIGGTLLASLGATAGAAFVSHRRHKHHKRLFQPA
jgi:hypothetical protein